MRKYLFILFILSTFLASYVYAYTEYNGDDCAEHSKANPGQIFFCKGGFWYDGYTVSEEYLIRIGELTEEEASKLIKPKQQHQIINKQTPEVYQEEYKPIKQPIEKTNEEVALKNKMKEAYETAKTILIFICIAVAIISVIFAYQGKVIFFDNYLDAFLNFSPVILVILGLFFEQAVCVYLGLIGALGYSGVQAYRLNPKSKWMIPLVGIGRFIIGFVVPLFIIVLWMCGVSSKRREGETGADYQARLQAETKQQLAIKTALTGGWLFLMNSLINGEKVRASREHQELMEALEPASEKISQKSDLKLGEVSRKGRKMDTKKCPYCAEEIEIDAIKCKYCDEDL